MQPEALPEVDLAAAADIARDAFGATGELKELPSYIDRNFRLRDAQGDHVLKIANAGTSFSEMEFECVAMDLLAKAQTGVESPRVRRAPSGASLVRVPDATGREHVARLVSFVPGTLLADVERPSLALLFDLGAGLGRIDRVLADVDHPARLRPLRWDIARASWIADDLHRIRLPEDRRLVAEAITQFRARLYPRLGDLPRGTIHNDANDYNVLVEGDRFTGLFDFGDMIESCRVFEPAIAATYAAFPRMDDPVEALCEVAAGYDREARLSDLELEVFLDCVRTRLATSVTVSARDAEHSPDNEYAGISESGAWALLRALDAVTPEAFLQRLRARCERDPLPVSPDLEALKARRKQLVGPSLSLSYREPIHMTRGRGQYLFDARGRAYLDCVNNVCHVGHCHPDVVAAASAQIETLNTNTRYLHENILDYVERLTATLPESLEVCFLVCSGSEANELAIRLARAATGRDGIWVLDHAYHGNTGGLVGLSPYKFDGPGGGGRPPHVRVLDAPDPYRAARGIDGATFADRTVGAALEEGEPPGAFFAESLLGCGGQVIPPAGYLARAFSLVRDAGGVAVADEVQVGFGRVGTHMWAFEAQGAVPDIVTMGKPIGNGHPMGAVVTTRAIAEAFANGMEYFNTFGGNPVSCATGLAVLDVIARENLMENAQDRGVELLEGLRGLQSRHDGVGDVRGMGLFVGMELVTDAEARTPDAERAKRVVERCRAEGILLSTDGPLHNVVKIKPPIVFDAVNVTVLVDALDRALGT